MDEILFNLEKKLREAILKARLKLGISENVFLEAINNNDTFSSEVTALFLEHLIKISSEKNEVPSSYDYGIYETFSCTWRNLQEIEKEVTSLKHYFPELKKSDYDNSFVEKIRCGVITMPIGAERWVAVINKNKLADSYEKSLLRVFESLKNSRNGAFLNNCVGNLSAHAFKESERTKKSLELISHQQKNKDILIIPMQFGLRHRGRSALCAESNMVENEFGLGAMINATLLLTHPLRLSENEDLRIDCVGDEMTDYLSPFFLFCNDNYCQNQLKFGVSPNFIANSRFGASTGFTVS
ncbi:MAG: hypothetical protein ACOYMB_00530 [Patescibacteria group bacterium]